jgi:hypothetical protein
MTDFSRPLFRMRTTRTRSFSRSTLITLRVEFDRTSLEGWFRCHGFPLSLCGFDHTRHFHLAFPRRLNIHYPASLLNPPELEFLNVTQKGPVESVE